MPRLNLPEQVPPASCIHLAYFLRCSAPVCLEPPNHEQSLLGRERNSALFNVLLEWSFPGGGLGILSRKAVVFDVVEGFHDQVCSVQWFGACR